MASRKGVSPIFASILLIMIVVASASVIYSSVTRLTATGPYQTSDLLEDLKIINVAADSDHVYIYTLNRGGIDAVVDSVYVEAPSGTLLMRVPVYYNVSAGEIVRIAIPRGGLDLSAPLNFKLATKRGTIASSLELVKYNIIPTIPSLLTYYPSLCNIITGSYVSGSLPSSVESVDGSYYTIASSPSFDSYEYHPSSFTVYQGSYVNGSVSLLQLQDSQSMYFLSSPLTQIFRRYNASSYNLINGSLESGSLEDTYAEDERRMVFSANISQQTTFPISNMNFTSSSSGWYGDLSEYSPPRPSTPPEVSTKASGLVSANQRALARTGDPYKTIFAVYNYDVFITYSMSVNDGFSFAWYGFPRISNDSWYEQGRNPSIASDINNNIHITYEGYTATLNQIKYVLFTYNSSYGGNPRTSTSYQTISQSMWWASHFVAMKSELPTIEIYLRNASTSPSWLKLEIRKILIDGTPDLSPSGLVTSVNISNVPTSSFAWVNVEFPQEVLLNKGSQYAVVLSTNGSFQWAYTTTSYAGSLGGWSYNMTSWLTYPHYNFCLRIPGWVGWTSSSPITIYSVPSTILLQRPVIATYPYLTSQDQQFYSAASSISVYGSNYYAQSFVPSSNVLSGIMLYLYRSGSPGDHLYVEIRKNNGTSPDMSSSGILTSGRIDYGRVIDVAAAQWFDCIFTLPAYLDTSQTYWIVVYSPSSNSTNYWIWYRSTSDGYPNGNAASSSNGGQTWTPQAWDFSFRTYASKDERPALSWYYQAPTGTNRLRVMFIRCRPGLDPSLTSSWYNYAGSSNTPDNIYQVTATGETRVSMTFQPNTNNIYFIFTRADQQNIIYRRVYRWNPDTGNWGAISGSTTITSGVNYAEFSSAPEPYDNYVVFAFVLNTGYTQVRYFTSANVQINISPPSTSMRYPTLTCIAGRIYILYTDQSRIYYRYYDGSWSGEYLYYSGTDYSLPNSLYKPSASSVDFVWLNRSETILYGSIFPTGIVKTYGPEYDPTNGNPLGSGGGSLYSFIDDSYFDYSFHRFNVTYFTNFTSPPSWFDVKASFAWQFNLTSSGKYNYGNYSHVRLSYVALILADSNGNDLAILYRDDNYGMGWVGVSVGYFYRTDISVNYAMLQNTVYRLKVVFSISCSDPLDLYRITARIDDVGISFVGYSAFFSAEFSGTSDTDEWSTLFINITSNVTKVPAECIVRVYNFELNRYPLFGEQGYFNFSYQSLLEENRVLEITSGANSFRGPDGGWRISVNLTCSSNELRYGLNMLNFIPKVNVHSISVEFSGTSNVLEWTSLLWNSTQAFSVPSVEVSIRLYNYTAGSYQSSGFGYMSYTSSNSPFSYESFSQSSTDRPGDFKDASGNWKMLITATKAGRQFYMLNDYILYSPTLVSQQSIDAYFVFQNINVGTIFNMTYNTTSLFNITSVNVTFQIWDYSTSSWSTIYSTNYISGPANTPELALIFVPSDFWKYVSSGESRVRIFAFKNEQSPFNFNADQIKLDIWAF